MPGLISAILLPVIVLATVTFLILRLRLFSGDEASGRFSLLSGGIFLFLVSLWQTVKAVSGYSEWFVASAYPFLDLAQFILLVIGIVLAVVGLSRYGDFWEARKEEVESREQKLSLLADLQREVREPYQLLELLNISIKEIIAHFPECAGAVFLLNRSRRQFVLTSSVGLTKEETAALEYYPLERNIVSQAVDLGDPVIAGRFDFVDRTGKAIESRFTSYLVLPLVSEMDKIGGIILFTEQAKFFGRAEIRSLSPVAEWLAEKIKSARLSRELTTVKNLSKKQVSQYSDLTGRLFSAIGAYASPDLVASFCENLVGFASCQSVHLYGLVNGTWHLYGGSGPLEQLPENYKTALVDALERTKPLIVNQEAVTEEGRSYIAFSSLVCPLGGDRHQDALLLSKESGPFKVDDTELKEMELFARLAALALDQIDSHRLDITRRKGFQKILQLLRFDTAAPEKEDWDFFIHCLADILPSNSTAVIFVREPDGSFKARDGFPAGENTLAGFKILPGEGGIGDMAGGGEPTFTFGRNKVAQQLESYSVHNREVFNRSFGEKQPPIFMATCPIANIDKVIAVVAIFVFDLAESERTEWERLITLAVGLYSTRLTARELLYRRREAVTASEPAPHGLDEVVNRLNNHLSAVIGTAELAASGANVPEEVKSHFERIITEAEQAAGHVRSSLTRLRPGVGPTVTLPVEAGNLNEVLNSILQAAHISENVYMLDGKPKEITAKLTYNDSIELANEVIRELAAEALSRFASHVPDEDVITVSTYKHGSSAYLDISRHRRNFPEVEPVAGFGEYLSPSEVLRYRPGDSFLQPITDKNCYFAFDRFGQAPTYLSFKFPIRADVRTTDVTPTPKARILAIDDQPVILDLISAMCRSLGYDVLTASSGEEGLKIASQTILDIVLTDLAMPGMSGLEVARSIRRLHPHTPIVLVTGWEVNVSQSELEAVGVKDVLYKPFRIEQLTDIIQAAVSSKSLL